MLMRRTALLLALALVATMAIAGVTYAKTIVGTNGNDTNPPIRGSNNADTLYGLNGNEVILGRGGDDEVYGGRGREDICGMSGDDYLVGDNGEDWLRGGAGDDRIEAADGDWDQVYGGPGVDRASVDEKELQHPGSVQNVEFVNGRRR